MITLIRWILIKSKEIKYRLTFWKIIDKIFIELAKNPEQIEQKLIDSVIKLIVTSDTKNKPES